MYRKKEALPFLAERLRLLRRTSGMTQQELADALHVERCTYAFYETGKSRPDLGLLLRIARIYHVPVDLLIDPDCDMFTTGVGEKPIPPAVLQTRLWEKRDKNETQLLAMFRQLNVAQQEQALLEIIKLVAPSEN